MAAPMDWYQIPLGVGIAILLFRELTKYLGQKQDRGLLNGAGKAGDKSADYWETCIREIVFRELERHIFPRIQAVNDKQNQIHDAVMEILWIKKNDRRKVDRD